jgi:hypothetical protein
MKSNIYIEMTCLKKQNSYMADINLPQVFKTCLQHATCTVEELEGLPLIGWQYLGTFAGPATLVTATDSLHDKHGVTLDETSRKIVVNGYQCIKCDAGLWRRPVLLPRRLPRREEEEGLARPVLLPRRLPRRGEEVTRLLLLLLLLMLLRLLRLQEG